MSEQPLKPKAIVTKGNFGLSEHKKTELDALTLQVLAVQHDVDRSQAIVDLLTQKTADLQGFLGLAEKNRTQTYYKSEENAFKVTAIQLAHAQATLDKALIKLKSLQSGLNAANAAALAS